MLTSEPSLHHYQLGGCDITCIVTGNRWKQNSYIVMHSGSGNAVVIDPGDCAELIIKGIEENRANATHILLTHPHHDHVGAAQLVSEHFNIPCEVHKDDVRLLMHAPMYALSFAKKKIAAVSAFRPFEELCTVEEAPAVSSLHTPGHTRGSVCYLFDGFAFTGDTLLYQHVGRTDLPGASADQLSCSIDNFLLCAAAETIIFPGHGKPWSVAEAREWWREAESSPER